MGVGSGVDDSSEEKGILEKPLYGLYEEGGEIPSMSQGRCERSGMRQIGRERWRGRQSIEMGECSRVTSDVRLVRRFEGRDLGAEPTMCEKRYDRKDENSRSRGIMRPLYLHYCSRRARLRGLPPGGQQNDLRTWPDRRCSQI